MLNLELLEDRSLPATFLGTTWDASQPITFSLNHLNLNNIDPILIHNTVKEALSLWSAYAPLNFVEVPAGGMIDISETTMPYLGYTYSPGYGGDVYLNIDTKWRENLAVQGFNLSYVLTHELGHALGLGHSNEQAIMQPSYQGVFGNPGQSFLYPDDIEGIQTLYGAGRGSVSALADPHPLKDILLFGENGIVAGLGIPYVGYTGHISITGRDINGDEVPDIITEADNHHIKVFDGATHAEIQSYMAQSPVLIEPFVGYSGSFASVRQISNEGGFESSMVSVGNHVKIFNGNNEISSSFAYENYDGQVDISAGVYNGRRSFFTKALNHIKVFDALTGNETGSFLT